MPRPRFSSTAPAKNLFTAPVSESATADELSQLRDLAWKHAKGDGVPKNKQLAIQTLEVAANRGSLQAMYDLGHLYWKGRLGVTVNLALAEQWLRKAAVGGHQEGQRSLASVLQDPAGNPRLPEAIEWLTRAAQGGLAAAMYDLGNCYRRGIGCAPDLDAAVTWWMEAAKLGHPHAAFSLADAFYRSETRSLTEQDALHWYQKAALGGIGKAQTALRRWFAQERGASAEQYVQWYQSAALAGHAFAQRQLGRLHQVGHLLKRDLAEAAYWYQLAAEAGDGWSQYEVALLHEKDISGGIAGAADPHLGGHSSVSFRWMLKAAKQCIPAAQTRLALYYARGQGTVRSDADARVWFRKAAALGYAEAMFYLSQMLARGIGGPHDLREAHRLLQRACMEDHPHALVRYGNLHETGDTAWGVSHNPGAAFRYYQRAAVRHDAPAAAYFALAMCYERGIGTTPSPPQALLYLRQAAAGGHKGALYLLRQRGDYSISGAPMQPGDSPAAIMPDSPLLGALPLRTIHVSPLPSHYTARDVGQLFAKHGGVVGVKLLRIPSTPLSTYLLPLFVGLKKFRFVAFAFCCLTEVAAYRICPGRVCRRHGRRACDAPARGLPRARRRNLRRRLHGSQPRSRECTQPRSGQCVCHRKDVTAFLLVAHLAANLGEAERTAAGVPLAARYARRGQA
jgi:TPR repeat protein